MRSIHQCEYDPSDRCTLTRICPVTTQIADMSSVEEDEEEDADDKNDEDNLTNGEVPADTAGSVDWGAPVSKPQTADSFDWGAPASKPQTADAMDWGAPAASSSK